MSEDKQKGMADFLKKANSKLKKLYDADVLFKGKDVGNFKPYATGFPTLDNINSGIGGFPRGGITLIHGLESTGKSTLVLEAIKHNMDNDPNSTCLYIDAESALTESFLTFKGIDPSRLMVTSLNTEDGLNIAKDAIKQNIFDIIVIDSLAKLDTKKAMDADIDEKKQRAMRAMIITEFLRYITFTLRQSNTALVMINQEIDNQERVNKYQSATVLPCGKQQVFSANLRLQLKRSTRIKSGSETVGYVCNIVSLKNKIASYERAQTSLQYLYGHGFVRESSYADYLEACKVIKKSMGYYSFVDPKYYDGKFRLKQLPEILTSIYETFGVDFTTMEYDNIEYAEGEVMEDDIQDDEGQ